MTVSGLVRFHDDLTGLLIPIDAVHQHPGNYNNGDVDALAESIEVNGMYRPLYVQKSTHHIVAGNTTWEACKSLGAEQVPVIFLDLDDIAATKIMLADNRVAQLAQADDAHLLRILDDLAVTDTLTGTGWNDNTVEGLRLLQNAINHTPLGWTPQQSEPLPTHTCPMCGHTFTEAET